MITEFDNSELQVLKDQLALLNNKLSNQQIVSQRLIRRVLSSKISNINSSVIKMLFLFVFAMVLFPLESYYLFHLSVLFNVVSVLFFLTAIVYTYWCHYDLTSKVMLDGDLRSVSTKLVRLKKRYLTWQKYALPFSLVWLVWFITEIYFSSSLPLSVFITTCIGLLVGAIFGGIYGYTYQRKLFAKIDDMIVQIDELNAGEGL